MKILFSPSESKASSKEESKASSKEGGLGEHQGKFSKEIISLHQKYLDFVRSADFTELQKMWGYKKLDDVLQTKILSLESYALPAIRCYRGVAYEALDFDALKNDEQEFLFDSVIIFSNLFGAVSAREMLPFYKLKQGEGFGDFKSKDLYRSREKELDRILEKECVIDLRAEFYQKLYALKTYHFAFEFLKNNKRISHYAKYYRGIVLREIAKEKGIKNLTQRLEALGLKYLQSQEGKNQTKLIFAV